MAPKGKQQEPKAKKKDAAKLVEDRTFGMKNKKGAQNQRVIAQMTVSAKAGGTPEEKKRAAEKEQREREKKAAEEALKEAASLFQPVQKVPFGVDPKSVLCQYYKKGACDKGRKCKFSHDLAIERKTEKASIHASSKEEEEEKKKTETSADWDEEKLKAVVLSKKGNQKTTTDKVCKFFIEAVEDGKYGWFWTCPNGGDKCMYQHKLPPGYILKTKEQRAAEKALMDKSPLKTLTLEDFLESERHKLTGKLTPVTPETFAKWKAERMDKKQAEEQARLAKEATGRALFEKGDWNVSGDEDESNDEDDEEWNLEKLRQETEATRERKEAERIAALGGVKTNETLNGASAYEASDSVDTEPSGADDAS